MQNELSNLILDNLPYVVWFKDIDGKYLYANNYFLKFWEKKRNNVIGHYDNEIFDPETALIFSNADKRTLLEGDNQTFVDIIKNATLQCYKKVIYKNNKLIGILGSFIDISSKIVCETELKVQKELLKTVFDAIPDTIFYKDVNSNFLGCNKACADFHNFKSTDEIIGKTDFDLQSNKDLAKKFIERDKHIMKTRKSEVTHVTVKDASNSGNDVFCENVKAPIIIDNEVYGVVGISRNITYRRTLEEKLKRLSYTDSLTGLYNRAYFQEKSSELLKEESLPLSIIMGDINGLKIINDSLGHLKGDQLILDIAQIIKSTLKNNNLIFRWGGDEIIILLPNINSIDANKLMSEIYLACENDTTSQFLLSIALGCSTISSLNISLEECLKEAEDKVYKHKLLQSASFRSSLIDTLQHSLLEKSEETEQHAERLKKYAILIGKDIGLSASELDDLVLLCNLHDIGKIGISENILMKPSLLTKEEFSIMKTHTEKGYRITQHIPELSHISTAILAHHERWDGTGYPLELCGEYIPLISRIVSVVDAFDAMTNDRIYHKAISIDEAIDELKQNSGTQFDPKIITSFLKILKNE